MCKNIVNIMIIGYYLLFGCWAFAKDGVIQACYRDEMNIELNKDKLSLKKADGPYVRKMVLDNGMTVLVRQVHTIPKVSIQIWYDVGSKDEELQEKGIAHLIEHMIFKGTEILSESDLNILTHKLSGSCNAFTSYDYTGYLFNFPTHHWREALPLMADCMVNCSFKDDMLNSEMKAVIQELKMGRDSYQRSLMEEMIGVLFPDHPYHYPIIGYKRDLWSVSGSDLLKFYKKHYLPNNATLVVVGDVNADEVFQLAKQHFGHISADFAYQKTDHHHNKDIISRSITLYRDIKQPLVMYSFVAPGARKKVDHVFQIIEWVIGKGKSSRLYKKLVNELQIATAVGTGYWDLFDHSIFFVICEPKTVEHIDQIEQQVIQELFDIAKNGITDDEFNRGLKNTQMALYSLLEDMEDQAYQIGASYLATEDENYVFTALQQPVNQLKQQAQSLIVDYFRPSVMNKGMVLPLPEEEKVQWAALQEESDKEDERILSARIRKTPIEPPMYTQSIQVKDSVLFAFPKADTLHLSNGLKVLYHHNPNTPKITLSLEFKARHYYDPDDKQGLFNFVAKMLSEGTKNYSSTQLADIIESRGMSLKAYTGGIAMSMLSDDLAFGLEILEEIIIKATFPEKEIEKVRMQILAEIKIFWDEPRYFSGQLVRETIYKGHPYSKNSLGSVESVKAISRDDMINFYEKYIGLQGARIAIVGDLKDYNLVDMLENRLGKYKGVEVEDIEFPALDPTKHKEFNYPINRDQVVLSLACLSIKRMHPDFDKFLLFNQIFGGGALGSMASRLFQLREETGLFYTIRGSLLVGSDEQQGIFQVKTIVSLDRLQEAEKVIKQTINTVTDTITLEELMEAKRAVVNTLVDNFSSNSGMAQTFLYLDRFSLSADYFDTRAADLEKVTLADMQQAVKKVLGGDNLLTLRVGRV